MTDPAAVVLAAGDSSRFWPLSARGHKSLFVLEGVSLLERTLRSLAGAGVKRFVVVQSSASAGATLPSDVLPRTIAAIDYVEQPEPAGQGDAVLRCADLLPDTFLLVQPENINAGIIATEFAAARDAGPIVTVAVTPRADWQLYAVVEHDGPVLKTIVEKPSSASEATPLCNMGVYRLRREFLDYLRDVPADPLALIAAIERAASDGRALVHQSAAPFLPLKYPGHLWGHVRALHEGQLPAERVIASGDVYVGPNCRLENAILGPGVRVGAETGTVPVDDWDDLSAVVIGPGASIGARTILSGGVRIGADAIVHDGAIVEADVPDGAVVG